MRPDDLILVVEDSDEHYAAILRAFQKSGVTNPVARCVDGDEALDYLFQEGPFEAPGSAMPPAVVLLDLNLPGTDGHEVLERVKADPDLRKIPVVVLTTSDNPADVALCYDAGASSYIIKPIRFEDFLQKVRALKQYWFETVALPTTSD
jgi:CheY-like chemotaxis protein